jgi:predicted Zn-dependent protease
MISNHNKNKEDPPQKEIKFILELFKSNKFADAQKNIDKLIVEYPSSSILFNIQGAVLAGSNQFERAVVNYYKLVHN